MESDLSFINPLLTKIVSNFYEMNKLPSLSFALFVQEKLSLHVSFGSINLILPQNLPTPQTLFRCASITKAFTSIMLLQLRDKGLLSLDDPIHVYLSDILPKDSQFLKNFGSITLRNLASHSSGLLQEGDFDRWDGTEMANLEKILSNLEIEKVLKPYEKYHYSNIGYILLGIILSKIAKKPYKQYVQEEILKGLDMNSSSFDYNLKKNESIEAKGYLKKENEFLEAPNTGYGDCKPCGGLLTNIEDLSKYLNFLLENNKENVLKSNRELVNPCIMISPKKNHQKKWKNRAYGLGIFIGDYGEEFQVYSHSGGTWGFSSYWILIPELKIKLISWQNSDNKGLRNILETCLEIIIQGVKQNKKQEIKQPKIKEHKICYKHVMGDKIRIRYQENLDLLKMDMKENGEVEKGIKMKKMEKERFYKIIKGADIDEIVEFIEKKEEEEEKKPFPGKILKYKGGLYNYAKEKF